MGRGGSGSTLANLAKRRAQLQASRQALGLDTERGAPQAPNRTMPNPPPPPQAPADVAPADNPNDPNAMLAKVEAFIGQHGQSSQGAAPVQAPTSPVENIPTRPTVTDTMADRIDQLGATTRTPETQFYRLSGREGTPREIAIFSARMSLERQLNRPPTESELMLYIARPTGMMEGLSNPVLERPAQPATIQPPTGGP